MKIIYTFLLLALGLSASAQYVVNGTIRNAESLEPLTGATIRLSTGTQGVSSGPEGKFMISSATDRVVLYVSFLGYKTQEIRLTLPLKESLSVYLEVQAGMLNEVTVSTGYQELPRERSTGSFAQISNKRFNEQISTDILGRLEATTGSVSFDRSTGSGARIMVRGLSTIQGPKDPLIILDNFPYEGDIKNINPNDVENITILKDAAAASIWGSRAGNGVIVITTKKGRFNEPLSAEFNSSVTLGNRPDLSYIRQLPATDYIDVEQMLYGRGFYNSQINSTGKPVLSPVVELLIRKAAGSIGAATADTQISSLRNVDVREDFNRYIYSPSANRQYSFGLKGGSEVFAWNLSAGLDNNTTTLDATYQRINLRFQDIIRPLKGLQISTGIYYTRSNDKSGKSAYGEISSKSGSAIYPYASLADEQGNALPLARNYRSSYIETAGGGKLLDWKYYPLKDYQHTRNSVSLQDVTASLGVNYLVAKGLNADIKYQYERQQTEGRNLQDSESFYARDLVNSYTQINAATGAVSYKVPNGSILDLKNGLLDAHSLRGQLNYNHTWSQHDLSILAGSELRHSGNQGSDFRVYGYNENILAAGNADLTIPYPNFISGSTSFIPNPQGMNETVNRFLSVYGNGAYTFKDRYTLSLSARRDASNLFGLNVNDKWNPLWSAGAGWELSKEKFYRWNQLPFLKLRASYGFSGNINPQMSALTTIQYISGVSPYTAGPYARFNNYANPDLSWETSKMVNMGLDFRSQSNRISGSLEYYRKHGTNLFGNSLLDYTSGITDITKNVASMKGQGADLELNTLNIDSKLSWSTNINLSFYTDKITKYYLSNTQGSNFVGANTRISGLEGKPVYSLFSYRWAGLDGVTGDPMGYYDGAATRDYSRLTGSSTQVEHLKYHGQVLPKWFGSIGNTLSWNDLSLTARITFKAGHYFRRSSIQYGTLYSNGYGHTDYSLRWQKPGDEKLTTVPSLNYPASSNRDNFYGNSEILIEKADHARLQYLNLSYSLKRSRWKNLPVKNLDINLIVNNPGILWKANKLGLDPDYNFGSTALPPVRTYAIGLRSLL